MFTLTVDDDIRLKLYENHHAEPVFALANRNREHIGAWLPWIYNTHSAEDIRQFIHRVRHGLANQGDFQTVIYYRGEVAGGCGLMVRNAMSARAEIGYWLGQEYTGKGIITRATRALTDFGFGELGLNRIFIRAATGNRPSQAVAERSGFQREGVMRQESWMHNRYDDMALYAAIAEDWDPPNPPPRFCHPVREGVELRLFEERHTEEHFALTEANRQYLREWLPWLDSTQTVDDTREFIKSGLQQYAKDNGFQAGIWVEGALAGAVGFHYWDFDHRKTEIGYWLGQDYTGQGIMTAVVGELIDYAVYTLKLNRIEIPCATGNTKSCAIPKRLGFTHEGVVRDAEWLYDHYVDWHVFSLLADDWKQRGR